MHRGNNRLQREAENNGKDSVGDLRSASWLRGVCVDEKRPQDITGIRPYARMRATDLSQRFGRAWVAEVHRRITAKKRKRFPTTELVPELLELLRASIVALGCKQVDHLAVNT